MKRYFVLLSFVQINYDFGMQLNKKVYCSKTYIAVAIQKLFEIRIFVCARGDFTTSTRSLIFQRNVRKPSIEDKFECECTGLQIQGMNNKN